MTDLVREYFALIESNQVSDAERRCVLCNQMAETDFARLEARFVDLGVPAALARKLVVQTRALGVAWRRGGALDASLQTIADNVWRH